MVTTVCPLILIFFFVSGIRFWDTAPHVSASIGLLKSHFYDCTPRQLRFVLAITASNPTNSGGCNSELGYGIVQVKDAYDWLVSMDGCEGWDVPVTANFNGCIDLDERDIVFVVDEPEVTNAPTNWFDKFFN